MVNLKKIKNLTAQKIVNRFKKHFFSLFEMSYIIFEKCMDILFTKRKFRILFSNKKIWEYPIRKGFNHLKHEISFEELSSKNIVKYDLVVPLTIEDIKNLNNFRPLLNKNPIPIPSNEALFICHNKNLFNKKLIENNFKDLVPQINDTLPYPYILKKNTDEYGANSYIILNSENEQQIFDTLQIQDYYRQKLIFGKYEYATHILFIKNKIVRWINIKYTFENDIAIKGKDDAIDKRICFCDYLDIFSSILKLISFEGLCCVNYKIQNDKPMILEINPRFGGSLSPLFFSFIRYLD